MPRPIAFGYGRISHGADQRIYSPQSQSYEVKTFYDDSLASLYDWGDMYFDEDISGNIPLFNRPAGIAMQRLLHEDDAIIIRDTSRAFRNSADGMAVLDWCDRVKVKLYFLDHRLDTTTPQGRFVCEILICSAAFERRQGSERTKQALAERRRQGHCVSTPPIGWKRVGYSASLAARLKVKADARLVPDEELRIAGEVISRMRTGPKIYSFDKIALALQKAMPKRFGNVARFICWRMWVAHQMEYPLTTFSETLSAAIAKGLIDKPARRRPAKAAASSLTRPTSLPSQLPRRT